MSLIYINNSGILIKLFVQCAKLAGLGVVANDAVAGGRLQAVIESEQVSFQPNSTHCAV